MAATAARALAASARRAVAAAPRLAGVKTAAPAAATAVRGMVTEAIPPTTVPGDHLSMAVTSDGIAIITIDSKKEKVRARRKFTSYCGHVGML